MKRHAGFTLIELVIVIGLLGILTTTGISSGFTNQSDIGDLIAAEDAVIAEIRRARSANTEGLPRDTSTSPDPESESESESGSADLQEAADKVVDGVQVSPGSIDMVFGDYSFQGVEVPGETAPFDIKISKNSASAGNVRHLCVHSAIARVSRGECE